jgi:hypothetical protein
MSLADFNDKVIRIIHDDVPILALGDIDKFLIQALTYHSRLDPREIIYDITGTGGYDYSLTRYPETLDETDFATDTKWTAVGDFAFSGQAAVYTHSGGTGSITQASSDFLKSAVGSDTYTFIYTVSSVTSGCTATISSDFAKFATSLTLVEGEQSISFKSAVAPTDFKIEVTSTAGGFTLDDISLKQHTLWQLKVSQISCIEYPVGERIPTYLESEDWLIYDSGSGKDTLRLLSSTPSTSETIRITFILPYLQDTIDELPANKKDVFVLLASSLCCSALARHYTQVSDPTIDADAVDYGVKSQEYANRAKELMDQYSKFMGADEDVPAASATKDWDVTPSPVFQFGDYLFHGRKTR